ncbi:MAG: 3-dehydro-L-gulonate 2-dehydrogenase [bacterium]|nr:3-dehydro-L-gulonate 2-dehydrogenase [Chitinophagaceae bacterium]
MTLTPEVKDMTRIPFDILADTIRTAFLRAGMPEAAADICARIHAGSSCDGVYSHGLNRVERFVDYIHRGWVDVHATAECVESMGLMEIWDGRMGPGITNALTAMDRCTALARQNGMGLVCLRNTTHWMRGGTYGWQAAEQGCMAICWTNTESCMPAWGATSECIGNNPFIMAVPREGGHIVLDMAMSQYSYGKLQVTRQQGKKLPYPGGFDHDGQLTDDPGAIEETRRILPMGYWKGSGFAMMLDLIGAILSGGRTTSEVDAYGKGSCGSCCQIFVAFDPTRFGNAESIREALEGTIRHLHGAKPVTPNGEIRYPGEGTLRTRAENLLAGVPVDENTWEKVRALAGF